MSEMLTTNIADFPVDWEQPADQQIFWLYNPMHFPEPLTAIDDLLIRMMYEPGFNQAAIELSLPIRTYCRCINGFHYYATMPLPLSEAEAAAQDQISQQKMTEAIINLQQNWQQKYLPEIKQYLTEWQQYDLANASLPDLIQHLDNTVAKYGRLYHIHFLVVFPLITAISMFDDFYQDLFESSDRFAPYKLLQGFDNKTLETDRKLWQLSRSARNNPTVRELLTSENSSAEIINKLSQSAAGQQFKSELTEFLNEYGQRSDKVFSYPSWIEDTSTIFKNLKDYIQRSDDSAITDLDKLAAEREAAIAETRKMLANYPEPMKNQFEGFLKAAQYATVLQEDHDFWIDCCGRYQVRRVFLAVGAKLAAMQRLAEADDIWYLNYSEIKQLAEPSSTANFAQQIAERKASLQSFHKFQPPSFLGTLPPGPPPDNPLTRAVTKFFGGPPPVATEQNTLRGNAGSPGVVTGPARVIHSLQDAANLQKGDILVTKTTTPPWTPLFATASAIVTDSGGILSHCAIVAREYQIPAVVGTGFATSIVKDGQLLEVDGSSGTVRFL